MYIDVAHASVEIFKRWGVKRIYGLIGTSILDLIDALYDAKDEIRLITVRHEQVAASMADAEGRLTGQPGIAIVHAGPGFLNSLISVANAYKDSSPMILIAGGIRNRLVGLDVFLEVPQVDIIKNITKAQYSVRDPSALPKMFHEAYKTSITPPAGPVFIEVAEDIWINKREFKIDRVSHNEIQRITPRDEDIDETFTLLKNAERPLILAGRGVNNEIASRHIERLVSKLKIPVATTGGGRGTISERHEVSLGRIGFGGGSTYADKAFEESDLVITFGCCLSDISTYSFNIIPKGDIVIVDLNEKVDSMPVPYTYWYKVDANIFLEKLVDKVYSEGLEDNYDNWWSEIHRWREGWNRIIDEALNRDYDGYVNPNRFFKIFNESINMNNAIISAGQGLHILYVYAYIKIEKPSSFLAATNLGAMGFAFPASLAAKLIYPEKNVISVVGDGEFMMTLQDFETAVREDIPVKVIVVNDNSYRVLYYRQRLQKGGRIYGTLLTNPDFCKVAEIFGGKGLLLDKDNEIKETIEEFLSSDRPTILELRIHPDDLPPLNLEASLKMTTL
jgi:acetolactate synthase-1/2/3 large subunit